MSYVWYEVLQDKLFWQQVFKVELKLKRNFFLSERNIREKTSPTHWIELEKL
jgi:hypothetical protein